MKGVIGLTDGVQSGAGNAYTLQTVANALALYPTYEDYIRALASGQVFVDLKINPQGWDVLGTSLSKANLLSDGTCFVLDIPLNSTPNDAFSKLALGAKKYGYVIRVKSWDGASVPGAQISGLLASDGAALVTDENGICVGVSGNQSVTFTVISPWIDGKNQSVTVTSTGILTDVSVVLEKKTPYFSLSGSGKYLLSPHAKSYDVTVVGGGGSGTSGYPDPSAGGGGGYINTELNCTVPNDRMLEIVVGAGGVDGGTTSVSANGNVVVSAGGGQAAQAYTGGAGNGPGGDSRKPGSPATGYLFDDSTLGVPGGGGGGGADLSGGPHAGGAPNGGRGGKSVQVVAESGKWPGGGGGGSSERGKEGRGASGGVFLRIYY